MDWAFAIERNREALKGVLAALVAMAGLAGLSTSFRMRPGEAETEAGSGRPTLPRHLHRAVLRLLRPAESAARRLVIVAARGLVVSLPPSRPREPKPRQPAVRPGVGTGILLPPNFQPQPSRPPRPLRKCALPLFDRLRRPGARKRTGTSGVPRICLPGVSDPFPVRLRLAPSPDDPIDAARLGFRLDALASALDDLPRQAKRFARWRMRRDPETAGKNQASASTRARRLSPLRLGRPPGSRRRPSHAVHDILGDVHALALEVLDKPHTSWPDTS